jgi:sigma-B regulation protein RsbU (phosphoserine phosphatase)
MKASMRKGPRGPYDTEVTEVNHSQVSRALLAVDPNSGVPVYKQVMDQVRLRIAAGLLGPGDGLPPARELSTELGINPAGVSKAYRHLERAGLLDIRNDSARVRSGSTPPTAGRPISEDDLELASKIQNNLLPSRVLSLGGWEVSYLYDSLGPTGGDYCDFVPVDGGDFYFMLGDVTGKGLAAALLMAHLHATFRALITPVIPVEELVARVSRSFCESTPPTHFATLVCGKAYRSGEMKICNAGHPPPLLMHNDEITEIHATGLPVGIFNDEEFSAGTAVLSEGDTLVACTDGLTETVNRSGTEYGPERLSRFVLRNRHLSPHELAHACRADLEEFRSGAAGTDDLTIVAIRRNSEMSRKHLSGRGRRSYGSVRPGPQGTRTGAESGTRQRLSAGVGRAPDITALEESRGSVEDSRAAGHGQQERRRPTRINRVRDDRTNGQ